MYIVLLIVLSFYSCCLPQTHNHLLVSVYYIFTNIIYNNIILLIIINLPNDECNCIITIIIIINRKLQIEHRTVPLICFASHIYLLFFFVYVCVCVCVCVFVFAVCICYKFQLFIVQIQNRNETVNLYSTCGCFDKEVMTTSTTTTPVMMQRCDRS